MKNKILSKRCCKHQPLPEELWTEILSRLPAKTLVRFCCVSKSWLSLISDPDFCRLHLKNFKNNVDETHLLMLGGTREPCVVRCSKTFETESVSQFPVDSIDWWFECFIDGLILLKRDNGLADLKVWNPSIRKSHDFPSVPGIETTHLSFFDIGLGYDPLVKDYKHVRLIIKKSELTLHSVAVYTLRAGLWKVIGEEFSNWHWYFDAGCSYSRPFYLQGCLYFFACDEHTAKLEVVSFDLSSEMFSSVSLPGVAHLKRTSILYEGLLTLVDGGCSLAVCELNHGRCRCMWMLERESMTWTKRYSFGRMDGTFLYVKKNDDMLLSWCKLMTVRLLSNLFQTCMDVVSSYNLKTREEKVLRQTQRNRVLYGEVYGYVESLILLK